MESASLSKKTGIADKKPEEKKETPMEFISSMAVVLVTGLFIVTFNMQAFEIPSSSMVETLLIGDHVFVDRTTAAPRTTWAGPLLPYRDIQHGDIIVFLSPIQPGLHVVKRIIGIPGDRLRLRNGIVYRNGEKLDEPYVIRSVGDYDRYRDEFPSVSPRESRFGVPTEWFITQGTYIKDGEITVPPDSYFGMGDNRDVSFDSRYWGFIPRQNVIGRPMFVYWSFDTPDDQVNKNTMPDRVKWLGHVALHFFDKTEWRRTLRIIR